LVISTSTFEGWLHSRSALRANSQSFSMRLRITSGRANILQPADRRNFLSGEIGTARGSCPDADAMINLCRPCLKRPAAGPGCVGVAAVVRR
jgi:hypothetical protein